MKIRCSGVTHRGLQRERNEDCMLIIDRVLYDNEETWFNQDATVDDFLFVVADGVGGSPAGDFASQFVLGYLSKCKNFDSTSLVTEIKNAHKKLLRENKKDPAKGESATTIAGITYSPNEGILVFNVGDARVYRMENNKLECITTDDNITGALYRRGFITTDKEVINVFSNFLLQSIGGRPLSRVKPHIETIVPALRERFLICTDGLYKILETDEIEKTIARLKTPDKILKKLVQNALLSGGPDNITAIFVEIEFPEKRKPIVN